MSDIQTWITKRRLCPTCGYATDRISGTKPEMSAPRPGDVSICVNCADVCIFEADLSLRLATPMELARLMECDETRKVIQVGQAMFRRRGRFKDEGRPA